MREKLIALYNLFRAAISQTNNALNVNIVGGAAVLEVNLDEANDGVQVFGITPAAALVGVSVDAAGDTQVDVLTSALPTGAATEGELDTQTGILTTIDTDTGAIAGSTASIDGKITACNTGAIAGTVTAQPISAILEGGLTELVGINEQVDQNDYSGSIGVALGGTYSGEILNITLYATEDDAGGGGAIQDSAGILFIFDADPAIASGDTSMSAADGVTCIAKVDIAASDWTVDTTVGICTKTVAIGFHALSTLYFVFKNTDATAINSAAADDEQLEFNFWYRRDS